ncbi:hypothetical protein ACE2AJ_13785 [Aquihabitans daechungensis]|uniref:hypothetical protein n=1 Tax=Aquihabitans daechungensis TaxID=1052257 RepID=UPI003BA13EBE
MTTTPPPPDADLPASWQEEDDDAARSEHKSRRWWIIGGVALVILAVIAAFAVVNMRNDAKRAWPEELGGRPAGLGGEDETAAEVTPTAEPGVYLWSGFDGWHLWVVNGEGLDGFSGTITSNTDFNGARSSAPDAGTVSVDGKEITFDLDGGEALAGVDFDPGFAKELTFDLQTADGEVPAELVFTGSGSAPVDEVPLVIDKPVKD